jgi:type IV secretion system protein VirD4
VSVWETNGGFYLGYHVDGTEGAPAPGGMLRYTGDRHVVVFGPNGSGKSRRLLLPNLAFLTGWSQIVIDPKGELLRMLGAHRAAHGAENVVFDPFGVSGVPSRGCNLLQALNPQSDDFVDDAMGQAEGLVEVGDTHEPHWPLSFQDLLAAVAMYARLVIPNATYGDVRGLLTQTDAKLREMVIGREDAGETFDYNGKIYPGLMRAGDDFDWMEIGDKAARFATISPDSRELHSILSNGLTQTRFLDSRPIKRELAGPAFDFSVLKQKPVTVWLILPARRLITHAKWLRLILTTAIQSLMTDTKKAKVPVAIVCDEAAALGHLPILENTVALMRGYGLKLVTIWQDLSQLKSIYKERYETFIGNAGVLQSFAAQDVSTAEYLSKLTGQTTRQAPSLGLSHSQQAGAAPSVSGSVNIGPIPMPLMLPQDIRAMDDGFSLIFAHTINGKRSKGAARAYLPYPTQIHGLEAICALDPAA